MKIFCQLILLSLLLFASSCKEAAEKNEQLEDKKSNSANEVPSGEVPLKHILFFGNSLTAGFGLEDLSQGWVSLIEKRIDSLNLPYSVINSGVSGETSAGGNSRIDWVLSQQSVDIFVLELGANDALRGLPVDQALTNLQSILTKVKTKFPEVKVIIAGMEAPPNLGSKYTTAFRSIYQKLAKDNKAILVPFILEGVGGVPALNQADGIHPNPEGNQIIRETIWKALNEVL